MSKLMNAITVAAAEITITDPNEVDLNNTLQLIINTVLLLIGLVAVVMIIFGGFRYTTSSGDSKKVTDAKNTILYGVIGLVIALLAFAIVNFVMGAIGLE